MSVQRDWLGHGLQLLGILVVLGLPLMIWGVSMSTMLATTIAHVERVDKDIAENRQIQTLIASQLLEITKQLTRLDSQWDVMREDVRELEKLHTQKER